MIAFKLKRLPGTYQNIVDLILSAESRGLLPNSLLFYGPQETSTEFIIRSLTEKFLNSKKIDLHPDKILLKGEEANQIGIKDARFFLDAFSSTPLIAKNKIGIIPHAERLTTQSQNALLKILEEPPEHSLLILVSDTQHSLLRTIRSRVTKIFVPTLDQSSYSRFLQDNDIVPVSKTFQSYCSGRIERTIKMNDEERVAVGTYAHEMYLTIRNNPYNIFKYSQTKDLKQFSIEACLPYLIQFAHDDIAKNPSPFIQSLLTVLLLSQKTNLKKNIVLEIENVCVQRS